MRVRATSRAAIQEFAQGGEFVEDAGIVCVQGKDASPYTALRISAEYCVVLWRGEDADARVVLSLEVFEQLRRVVGKPLTSSRTNEFLYDPPARATGQYWRVRFL